MVLATLALFIVGLGYGVVVPALPRLAGQGTELASAAELSIVYAGYSAAKIAAQVPGGVWVDRTGALRVLRVGTLLFTLSLFLFMVRGGPLYFAFVRALEGMATGLVYPAVFARVLKVGDPATSGRRLGVVVGLGSSGLLIGPVLGIALGGGRPILPIALVGALGILTSAFTFMAHAEARRVEASRASVGKSLRDLADVVKNPLFLALMIPVAFNKLTFSSYQGLLPLVGPNHLAIGPRGVAALFVAIGVLFGAAQPLSGALIDRFAPRSVVVAVLPALVGCLAALAFTSNGWVFGGLFSAHVFAQSIAFTATMKDAANQHGTEDTFGGVFGLLSTLTDTMTIVGPLLFLNVYAWTGMRVFAIMAGIGALAAVVYVTSTKVSSRAAKAF